MFKHCTLIIFGFIISYHCLSQDYREGYIIKNQNDTISGRIAYQPYAKYLKSCLFKADGIEHQYFPADIAGYGFYEGRYFASGIAKDKFVEAHIIGELSLYQSDTTFFLKKGAEIRELKTQTLAREIDGREGVMEDTKWKGIVSFMISDCIQNPMGRMATLKMQIKTLSKLAIEYNECRGSSYVDYGGTERRMKIDVGLTFGYTKSSIGINNVNQLYKESFLGFADTYTSQDPSIGLITQVFFPKFSERLGLQVETLYAKSSYQQFVSYELVNDMYFHDTFISVGTISVPVTMLFDLPIGPMNSLHLNVGINNDILTKKESILTTESVDEVNRVKVSEDTEMFEIRSYQGGVYGGLGIARSIGSLDVGLSFRYVHIFQFDDDSGFTAANNKMNLSIFFIHR